MNLRGKAVHFAGRFTYREQLEALWRAKPTLTIPEAMRLTGAPWRVAVHVRTALVAAGVLKGAGRWGT